MDVDANRFESTIRFNEFASGAEDQIEASFASQLGTILDLVNIDSLVGDLSFQVPAINGVSMTSLTFDGAGSFDEDVGVYTDVGVVPFEGGCNDTEEQGCGGGCANNGRAQGKWAIILFSLTLGFLRRRST